MISCSIPGALDDARKDAGATKSPLAGFHQNGKRDGQVAISGLSRIASPTRGRLHHVQTNEQKKSVATEFPAKQEEFEYDGKR